MMQTLNAQIKLRIDWSDMDMFGHVNNVSYFKFIQASRVNHWEVTGLDAEFKQKRIGPVLLSTRCRFIMPLHYPGSVKIHCGISFIKNTSFGLHHELYNAHGSLCAEADDVLVYYDFNQNEKMPIPEQYRAALMQKPGPQ